MEEMSELALVDVFEQMQIVGANQEEDTPCNGVLLGLARQ